MHVALQPQLAHAVLDRPPSPPIAEDDPVDPWIFLQLLCRCQNGLEALGNPHIPSEHYAETGRHLFSLRGVRLDLGWLVERLGPLRPVADLLRWCPHGLHPRHETPGGHEDAVAPTVDVAHHPCHPAQSPLRMHGSHCRQTLRPQVLHPQHERRLFHLLHDERRQPDRHWRGLEDEDHVEHPPTEQRSKERGEQHERQVVEGQHPPAAAPTRHQWHAQHLYSLVVLAYRARETVASEEGAVRVVRLAREDSDLVSTFLQPPHKIVDTKGLWPEILRDDEYVQILVFALSLKIFSTESGSATIQS